MNLSDRWGLELDRLKQGGRHRTLQMPAGIDFSSNDYLGYSKVSSSLAEDGSSAGTPTEIARAERAPHLARSGISSRLLRGQQQIWEDVETRLAQWHGAEAALMMTSGYAANEGLLSTVIQAGDTAFSDQYNHASIIDGLRLSKAEKIAFAHNDLNALESLLHHHQPKRSAKQAWFVVTESLFGMDGDIAPLRELAGLARQHDAHLIVDEAHATGCFGATGSGIVDALGLRDQVLATIHTGGKALAVLGAYIAGSRVLKDLLVNRCRHLIFTTALPPQVGSWWLDALNLVSRGAGTRNALHERARFFRAELMTRKITAGGIHYIASIVLGPDALAMEAACHLQGAGFDIRAIRPPTVAEATARLRISIHADHDPAVLRRLAEALGTLAPAVT